MNYFSTAPLIAAIGNLLLAFFVLFQAPRHKINRTFFLFGLSVAIWTFGTFMMFEVSSAAEALLWTRLLHIGVIFLPISLFHLSVLIARSHLDKYMGILYALGGLFLVADTTPYFINSVHYVGYGYFGVTGPLYLAFSFTIPTLSLPALFILLKCRQTADKSQRHRLSFLIAALAMLFVFGLHDVTPMLGIYHYPGTDARIYPLGTAVALIYSCLVAYSVLQHQLLDIRLGLGRVAATFTRLLFFCVIGFLLLLALASIHPPSFTTFSIYSSLAVLMMSGLISSFLFPRLLGGHTEHLERRILGDHFEYRDKIRAFIDNLNQYRLIEPFLGDLNSLFADILKTKWFQVTLFDSSTREVSLHHMFPPLLAGSIPAPEQDGALLRLIRQHPKNTWFSFSDLPGSPKENKDIFSEFPHADPAFFFPLRSAGDICGLLVTGEKNDGNYYTVVDLELISELCQHMSRLIDQIRLKDQLVITEQLESLSIMSRGLAHDLNNLVTPIHTYLQFAGARPQPDGDIADLLRIAAKNLDTIRAYVREAVFFSNTLAPKIDLIHARELFDGLASLCKHQLDKRNIGLCLDLTDPFDFHGDPILIQRLLSNLIFNAMDASPSGSIVTLRAVRLHRVPGHPAWIRLQVIDRGSGISAENLGRVFAPYFTTKNLGDQTRGFGLGLTICQKIVHLHRGTISIHSTEGRGTTVQIDLPAEPAASPATQPS